MCWQSGAALVDGEEYTFVAGERLRGDSPLVQATAQFWVIDGNEVPTHWDTVVERNEADRPPVVDHDAVVVHQPVPLEREDVRVLNRAITVLVGAGGDKELVHVRARDRVRLPLRAVFGGAGCVRRRRHPVHQGQAMRFAAADVQARLERLVIQRGERPKNSPGWGMVSSSRPASSSHGTAARSAA